MRWRLRRSKVGQGLDDTEVRRLARILAEEIGREIASLKERTEEERLRIDVVDALRELGSTQANEQLRRFYVWNHRWAAMIAERNKRTASETWDFIDEMGIPMFVLNQFEVVDSKRDDIATVPGHIVDLGVYKGASTRALARIFPDQTIHGFDSFEGLPDDWSHVVSGSFGDVGGQLPDVPSNVRLHKGWFSDTLGPWARKHGDRSIMLMRVDCDVYSSAKTVFDELGHLVGSGSWILFDELIGYRGWQGHEYRAFREFLERTKLEVDWIAHGLTYVLVRVR